MKALAGYFNVWTGEIHEIPRALRHKYKSELWRQVPARVTVLQRGCLGVRAQCALGWAERHERGLSGMAGKINAGGAS